MSIYDTLNPEQQKACFQTEGPVLILAGAGSGKTRVITHRIAYLMEECNVNPWNILAITFTNKAAGEMRERVDHLIGFGSEAVWISTFHSMCVRILRRHIDQLGYSGNFTIYDTDDQKLLVRQICQGLGIDPKQLRERTVMSAISSAKDRLQTPEQYQEEHKFPEEQRIIGDIYAEYERRLRANNALDFDDLLMKTVELFRTHPEVLADYQDRFHYIMVDEYQDTNEAQFQLVKLLAAKWRNLCVVGDDDQSIYQFRGADIRNILNFEKVYPDAMVVKLEQNYRSTQNILDAANAVIHHNVGRKDKKLWTDQGAGAKIHYREFGTGIEEASFIAEDIRRRMQQDRSIHFRDFAILYRTNAQSRLLEDRLVMASIPYNVVGGHNFYDRMEVRDILAYLRVLDNRQDDINVQRILNVPKRGIGKTTADRIFAYARSHGLGFLEALDHLEEIPDISRAKAKLSAFADLMHSLEEAAGTLGVEDLIKQVVARTGYEDYLRDYEDEDDKAQERIGNVNELISKAAVYEEDALQEEEGPSLNGFLEEVSLVADIDQVGEEDDRVLLMTLHSAKGLEFPYVYLAGMDDEIFPSYMSIQKDQDSGGSDGMEEERRLAYVGITRAKKELTLTHAYSRIIRGEPQHYAVSRFVEEIPANLMDAAPGKTGWQDYGYNDEEEDDMPWGGGYEHYGMQRRGQNQSFSHSYATSSRSSYDTGAFGGRNASGRGSSSSFSTGTGKGTVTRRRGVNLPSGSVSGAGNAGGMRTGSGSGAGVSGRGSSTDGRLRAVYRKPHTSEERKPFIAKMKGLDELQKGMPAGTKPDYGVGDRVLHVKYGEGTVKALEKGSKDYKVTVVFDEAGQKVMYAAFAKLQKL